MFYSFQIQFKTVLHCLSFYFTVPGISLDNNSSISERNQEHLNEKQGNDGTEKLTDSPDGREKFHEEVIKQDSEGDTCLHVTIINQHTEHAQQIIEILDTPELNIKNGIHQTPLHLAAIVGDYEVIRALLAKDVDGNAKDSKGRNFFHLLCEYRQVSAFALLVPLLKDKLCQPSTTKSALTAALNAKDFTGQSCLHISCILGNSGLVKILLNLGIDPNLRDSKSGKSGIQFACEGGHIEVVQALLEGHETVVDIEANDGITPVILAYHRMKHHVVALLRQHGVVYSKRKIERFGLYRD